MDNRAFSIVFDECVQELRALGRLKGGEYSQDGDRLSNFKQNGERFGIHPLQTWAIYVAKHQDAIDTFIRDVIAGKTRERAESIESRALDIALYMILFVALNRELNGQGDDTSAEIRHLIWEDEHKQS